MRCFLRRLILFPIALIGMPILFFIGWCMNDSNINKDIKFFLLEMWNGINKEE